MRPEENPQPLRLPEPKKYGSDGRPVKNKVQSVGVFFTPGKVTAKTPHQPRNSPQPHHDLPSKNATKNAKTPAKSALHHAAIFFATKSQKIILRW
ncbi:hypothetical protein [Tunturibacter empetritectus]|uniref:Uncharacterized protein n=1 Tax=Tunturiibacter lichenicola TaxID=2051959 RepID=A0A7W8N1R0_9BACT|nr:hypothetical protein [Edaphobacter lichenicola]MBB5342244.1 hypothetical protein [Edaphobacter lichenicola]